MTAPVRPATERTASVGVLNSSQSASVPGESVERANDLLRSLRIARSPRSAARANMAAWDATAKTSVIAMAGSRAAGTVPLDRAEAFRSVRAEPLPAGVR